MGVKWHAPSDMDPECVNLCEAMNLLPGIKTTESCCGHGKASYCIWFRVADFSGRGFITLARVTCPRYYEGDWRLVISHGDLRRTLTGFVLEGAAGPDRYQAAETLAKHIRSHLDGTTPGFNILQVDAAKFDEVFGVADAE